MGSLWLKNHERIHELTCLCESKKFGNTSVDITYGWAMMYCTTRIPNYNFHFGVCVKEDLRNKGYGKILTETLIKEFPWEFDWDLGSKKYFERIPGFMDTRKEFKYGSLETPPFTKEYEL